MVFAGSNRCLRWSILAGNGNPVGHGNLTSAQRMVNIGGDSPVPHANVWGTHFGDASESMTSQILTFFGSIRLRGLEEIRVEKDRIWGSGHWGALMSGLPDHIVENHIWPRIRRTMEDQEDRPVVIQENIRDTLAISAVSKKWRHLVTTSKMWAVIRFLKSEDCLPTPLTRNLGDFRDVLAMVPPIDVLSRFDLFDLVNFVNEWVNAMSSDDRVAYDDCLNDDFTGRVRRWEYGPPAGPRGQRLAWSRVPCDTDLADEGKR